MDALVGAAAVSAIPSTLAAVLSYRAVVHSRQNKAVMQQVSDKADENHKAIGRVETATNGVLTNRIREVLRDELIKHSQATTEMYDLLDAIIRNVQGEADDR